MTELRKALERPVADLVFDENRKNAVREKAFTAKRGGSALRRGAAVALVCTVLCVTAVAAGPSLWQYMQARQGPFAGLAQTVEGAVCTSGGIEIQVLSALADDVRGEVYFTVRDVEGDRLDSQLTLHCGADSDLAGRLVEYDSESRTALFAAGLSYYRPQTEGAVGLGTTGGAVPDTLHLAVERLTTRQGELDAGASCAGVTAALLDSLPLGEGDRVVMGVEESGYPASILPGERVVLAPGQTPMPLEGTGDVTISSMGFASDGRFHVRVAYAPGIGHGDLDMGYFLARVYPRDERRTAEEKYWRATVITQVEGGLDVLFPLIKAGEGAELGEVYFYGGYVEHRLPAGALPLDGAGVDGHPGGAAGGSRHRLPPYRYYGQRRHRRLQHGGAHGGSKGWNRGARSLRPGPLRQFGRGRRRGGVGRLQHLGAGAPGGGGGDRPFAPSGGAHSGVVAAEIYQNGYPTGSFAGGISVCF